MSDSLKIGHGTVWYSMVYYHMFWAQLCCIHHCIYKIKELKFFKVMKTAPTNDFWGSSLCEPHCLWPIRTLSIQAPPPVISFNWKKWTFIYCIFNTFEIKYLKLLTCPVLQECLSNFPNFSLCCVFISKTEPSNLPLKFFHISSMSVRHIMLDGGKERKSMTLLLLI